MSKKIRTLLIDDDHNLLEVVKEIVEQDGDIEIIPEGNPLTALRRLEEEHYDVIVCDYEMPTLDGLRLLRVLRENGDVTPFIMFTGKGREEVELDAFRSGASLYVQKRGGSLAVFAEVQNAIRQVSRSAETSKYEAGLEESVRTLKSTIDSMAMGVVAFTFPDSRLLYFNQTFLDLWGLDEKDMHRPTEEFFTMMLAKVRDPENFISESNRAAADPMTTSMAVISLRDGRTIARTSAPLLREGRLIGRVMTFRNEIESAFVRPEGSGHLFLSSSTDVTRDLVASLNAEGRIVYASPSFEGMSGYRYDELCGKLATTFIHSDDAVRIRETWASMIKEKVFGTLEYRFVRKDGRIVWLETKGSFSYALSGEVSGATLICRDISQRKKAEEDLVASESRYRQLVELAQGGILMVDKEARAVFANDYLANMLGRDRSDIVGRSIGEFVTRSWKDANGSITELISRPRSSFDVDLERSDGRTVHAHADFGWLRDDADKLTGFMAFITDISPRIMAEEELKESEQKFRAFVEESAEGVAISDENGRIIEWNRSLERIFETSRTKILGMTIFDFWKVFSKGMGEEYGEELQVRLRALIERGEWPTDPEPRKLNVFTPSGRPKVLQVLVFPFHTKKGFCASVLVNDITETSRIEQERAEAQQRYRTIFENAKEIIITLDKDGLITAANQAAGAYLGRPPTALVGLPLEKFIGDTTYNEIFGKTFASWDPRPHIGEVDIIVRGEHKVLELSCSPMLGEGTVVGMQCIGRDITGRRQAETAMDLANRKISLLGDITRHDVMNKLAALSGYVELARTASDPQKRLDYLNRVDQAARGIEAQMQFNKRYQALGSNRPQWTKLRTVCLNRVRLVDLKDILMEIDVDDVEIFADPMFESVIGNLLDNSIKHGGKVTHIKIGYKMDQNGLTIMYQDNGIGLAPADKRNIFNWDFRGRSGHGLHFISEVLVITGITITEDGEQGKGAHFNLRVPKEGFRLSGQEPMRDPATRMIKT